MKNEVRFESDLDLIKNIKTRVAVTKMRISCHLLRTPIESGRYKKIPRVERRCPLFNRSEIGDEFQYLLKCTHVTGSHIRGIFLESLYSIKSNFTNMSYKALRSTPDNSNFQGKWKKGSSYREFELSGSRR